MLAAAVVTLASVLAQAESAPPEPAAPSAPNLLAPLPVPPAPPPPEPPAPPAANALAVYGRFSYRVGDPGKALAPSEGFSLGGTYVRRYLSLPRALELGAAIDFFFDRFSTDVTGSTLDPSGNPTPAPGTRSINESSFALLQTAALALAGIRPFAGLGGGVSVGYFSSPETDLRPGSQTVVLPFARGALGLEVEIAPAIAVAVRADYSHVFRNPTYTAALPTGIARPLSFWGDLFDVGAGVVARF